MQQLTELQEKWLKALESGEYPQGKRCLGNADIGYCCLGVLCHIADAPYSSDASYLKNDWAALAGLRSIAGRGALSFQTPSLGEKHIYTLAQANDEGATFAEIAAAIRANPENFFLPPETIHDQPIK